MSSSDVVRDALRKAFRFGETYFQQADSEYTSQHRKADETMAKFMEWADETAIALAPPPAEAFDPSIHPIPGEGQQPAMLNGVEGLSPIYGQVPTVEEARTAIGTALDDAAKALRVLSTMLKKEKLMQGYAVADEILGRLGYATKLNAALAQQPAACRCVDCGGDQPGHDPHCANMREIHGTQPADVDGVLTPTGTFCSVCEAPQHNTPSGVSCPMGHGGAEPLVAQQQGGRAEGREVGDEAAPDRAG